MPCVEKQSKGFLKILLISKFSNCYKFSFWKEIILEKKNIHIKYTPLGNIMSKSDKKMAKAL